MEPVKTDVHFPTLESSVLDRWIREKIIERGLKANEGQEPFVFYDGPPFATGLPHYGHLLPGTLKDVVPRYWVMKGKYVARRWGWDCHGLPVEFEMEKELGLSGRPEVEAFGIAKFNESCRGIVQRFTEEWKRVIYRTGRWVDFDNGYRTMDPKFMESVWWVVRQLWDKGLIYEGYRVMPYSWRIGTPLSNFEAGLNYKDVQDPALTLRFKVRGEGNRYLLAWTTTPWTLPANLALAVGKDIDYVEVSEAGSPERYLVAADRAEANFAGKTIQTHARFKGSELAGLEYEPLFPYFESRRAQGAFRVFEGSHVTATDGTGIVHTAPAHGEEDFEVCRLAGIELVDLTDAEGKFTDAAPEYRGMNFKEADKNIIRDLKARGSVFGHDTFVHSYPFCWRSDTPLMNKAISTWFLKLEPLKEKLIANNRKTHWVPENLRDGRFGNWLENARDWNISRNRFWGSPIPIWETEDGSERICVGSLDELEELSGQRPGDLHKHFVDEITFKSPTSGKPMKRIPEVLDCWFESGSMPYAQNHYPFENREAFEKTFPADFIAEGVDQTRGWFYTLSVLSTALFDRPPFKNVIVNGLVLAEDGKKMSKRLKNYPDIQFVLDTYGADALRAYLTNSPAAHAEDLRFSEAGVREVVRSVLLPLWNAYSFFVTYARADGWDPKQLDPKCLDKLDQDLDRWILSKLHSLVQTVDQKMADYHLYEVVPQVLQFIDGLTNWYIRLNRRRFWSDEDGKDKSDAYATLFTVLVDFCKVLAPLMPFVTDEIYRNLAASTPGAQASVHLCRFPEVNTRWISKELEARMELVQTVVVMGRMLRNTHRLKTRQPLKKLLVITRYEEDRSTISEFQQLIAAELNVGAVEFSTDEGQWVTYVLKPNAKKFGPRFGAKAQGAIQTVKKLTAEQAQLFTQNGIVDYPRINRELGASLGVTFEEGDFDLARQPKEEGAIQTDGQLTLWLDTHVDHGLMLQGIAREFVNRTQKLRKDRGLEVSDRIRLYWDSDSEEVREAITTHRAYICAETLAAELEQRNEHAWTETIDLEGVSLKLALEKHA